LGYEFTLTSTGKEASFGSRLVAALHERILGRALSLLRARRLCHAVRVEGHLSVVLLMVMLLIFKVCVALATHTAGVVMRRWMQIAQVLLDLL